MRWRMRRRSVSSFVSPGPRVPMPPPSRDSAVPDPASRGSRYSQLRELDLPLAFPRARTAREDVENQLRAIEHLPLHPRFDLAQLRRRQLVVEDDDGDVGLVARRGQRRRPCRCRGTWRDRASGRSCDMRRTTVAPAASARPASSSSERSACSRLELAVISPTIAARSGAGACARW